MRATPSIRGACAPPFSIDGWVAPGAARHRPAQPVHRLARAHPPPRAGGAARRERRRRPRARARGRVATSTLPPATVRHVRKVFPNSRQIEVAASATRPCSDGNGECAATLLQRFLGAGSGSPLSCAAQPAFAWPGVGRFPAPPAPTRAPRRRPRRRISSKPADRRLAAAAAATVTDALRRGLHRGTDRSRQGVRGRNRQHDVRRHGSHPQI